MLFLPIVYYGKRGLEAETFESYMRLSGYTVQLVHSENGYLPEVVNTPASIAVISADKPPAQILELASQIRARTDGCVKIFVLEHSAVMPPEGLSVEVISPPHHLSKLVKCIQAFSRNN